MKLKDAIELHAGGVGSGCQGPNCGRKAGHTGAHIPKNKHEDTREYFGRYTSSKPAGWHEVKKVKMSSLLPHMVHKLAAKPKLNIDSRVHHVIDRIPGLRKWNFTKKGSEFLLHRAGKKYYVNTEGYDYARYIFEIDDDL